MDERVIRGWLQRVRGGSLSRRELVGTLLGLGLTPALIAELLQSHGVAHAQPRRTPFIPSRRGGGGELKMLWWQAPTILNPHLAIGVKDGDGSRIFYEPLGSFDPDGNHVPVLAAEVPTVPNGGVGPDGLSVTPKAEHGVPGAGGKPVTGARGGFNRGGRPRPADRAVAGEGA